MLVVDENSKTYQFKGRDGLIIFIGKNGDVSIVVRKSDVESQKVSIDQYKD